MPLADTPSGLFRLHKRVRRAYGSFSDVARMVAALASRHDYSEIISDEGTRLPHGSVCWMSRGWRVQARTQRRHVHKLM